MWCSNFIKTKFNKKSRVKGRHLCNLIPGGAKNDDGSREALIKKKELIKALIGRRRSELLHNLPPQVVT